MNMNAHDKYMGLGIVRNGSNNDLKRNALNWLYNVRSPFVMKHSCLKIQPPFLEALRYLHGQIKLSFKALKIPLALKTFNRVYESTHFIT